LHARTAQVTSRSYNTNSSTSTKYPSHTYNFQNLNANILTFIVFWRYLPSMKSKYLSCERNCPYFNNGQLFYSDLLLFFEIAQIAWKWFTKNTSTKAPYNVYRLWHMCVQYSTRNTIPHVLWISTYYLQPGTTKAGLHRVLFFQKVSRSRGWLLT
jgi:hypothetical protein